MEAYGRGCYHAAWFQIRMSGRVRYLVVVAAIGGVRPAVRQVDDELNDGLGATVGGHLDVDYLSRRPVGALLNAPYHPLDYVNVMFPSIKSSHVA